MKLTRVPEPPDPWQEVDLILPLLPEELSFGSTYTFRVEGPLEVNGQPIKAFRVDGIHISAVELEL